MFRGCLGCCFTRSGSEALPPPPPKYPSGGGDGGRRRRGGGGEVAVVGGGERGAGGGGRGVVPAGQGRRGVRDAVQGVRHRHPLRRRRRHRRHRRSSRGGRRIGKTNPPKKKKSHRSHHVTTGFALMCSVTPRKRRWTRWRAWARASGGGWELLHDAEWREEETHDQHNASACSIVSIDPRHCMCSRNPQFFASHRLRPKCEMFVCLNWNWKRKKQ